jgi:hypothetical protein
VRAIRYSTGEIRSGDPAQRLVEQTMSNSVPKAITELEQLRTRINDDDLCELIDILLRVLRASKPPQVEDLDDLVAQVLPPKGH